MKAPSPEMSRGRLREVMGAKGRGRRRAARELAEAAREVVRVHDAAAVGQIAHGDLAFARLAERLRAFDQATS